MRVGFSRLTHSAGDELAPVPHVLAAPGNCLFPDSLSPRHIDPPVPHHRCRPLSPAEARGGVHPFRAVTAGLTHRAPRGAGIPAPQRAPPPRPGDRETTPPAAPVTPPCPRPARSLRWPGRRDRAVPLRRQRLLVVPMSAMWSYRSTSTKSLVFCVVPPLPNVRVTTTS